MGIPRFQSFLLILLIFLNILFVGVILLNNPTSNDLKDPLETCQNIDQNIQRVQCWEKLIEDSLKIRGLQATFHIFEILYNSEPQFSQNCHGFAHKIGEEVYDLFAKGKDFDLPPQTAYCGYGFYHGFTEKLLRFKSGPKEAGKLCDSKKEQIASILYDACYHGIGHGLLSLSATDSKIWGNTNAITTKALKLCEEATDRPVLVLRCSSGVFMELAGYLVSGEYALSLNKKDPLEICKIQEKRYRNDCYTQMNGVLSFLSQGSFSKGAEYLETIPEDSYAKEAIITLVGATASIQSDQRADGIISCRSLSQRLQIPCIEGLALAFMLRGSPGKEYQDALELCRISMLTEDERMHCFKMLINQSRGSYTKDKFQAICDSINAEYRKYCSNL